ncbi:hypothetical protein CVT24_001246 [Panaeolus cyanescens]|uniref:Uncharacterized protein n=1 Tax=Panaeolus cyanescens TaxID=181874 RepID=A0A409YFW1_9AGAR|nr:hypothetical protein CVT24_001246 [Panaeolus cyanescens]
MLRGPCQGEAVFPALKTVDLGIETLALWTLPILFEQLPSLECFVGHGYSMPYIDLAECLDPVAHHLTTLELGWPFSGSGLHGKAQQQESPLVQAFNLLECLCLPALETFRLSIQVNPCIHDLVDNVKVYKALAAVINTYQGIIGLDAFPALKSAEFNLEMKVRVKVFRTDEKYVRAARWPLNKCLSNFVVDSSVPYSFAYEEQDVYSRDLNTKTHLLQLRSHFISTMSTRELVEELEKRVDNVNTSNDPPTPPNTPGSHTPGTVQVQPAAGAPVDATALTNALNNVQAVQAVQAEQLQAAPPQGASGTGSGGSSVSGHGLDIANHARRVHKPRRKKAA